MKKEKAEENIKTVETSSEESDLEIEGAIEPDTDTPSRNGR